MLSSMRAGRIINLRLGSLMNQLRNPALSVETTFRARSPQPDPIPASFIRRSGVIARYILSHDRDQMARWKKRPASVVPICRKESFFLFGEGLLTPPELPTKRLPKLRRAKTQALYHQETPWLTTAWRCILNVATSFEGEAMTTIQKWGNSLAIRIPRTVAGQLDVEDGASVELQVREGELIIRPVRSKKLSLSELLINCKPSQLHGETDFGEDVGREVLE